MALSSELVSQFTKITNDSKRDSINGPLRGVIVMYDEVPYVKLDGSDEITPIARTVEVAEGDRVEVTLTNHTATVTGNLSDPSIGVIRADGIESSIARTASEIRSEITSLATSTSDSINRVDRAIASLNQAIVDANGLIGDTELGLREDLDALNEYVTQEVALLNSSITQTASQIRSEVSAQVTLINAAVDTNSDAIANLSSSITQTATEIRSEVSTQVNTVNTNLSNLDSELSERITQLDNAVDQEIANLSSSITQTATEIRSEVSASVTVLNSEIGANRDSITDLSTSVSQTATEIRSEVNGLSDAVTTVTQDMDGVRTAIVSIDGRTMLIEQTIEGLTVSGPGGSTLIHGGSIDTSTLKLSRLNAEENDLSMVEVNDEGMYVQNAEGLVKIRLGYTTDDLDYPYVMLGAGRGAGDGQAGLFKKFVDGLWIGNSVPMNDSGYFSARSGYNGIFIRTDNNGYKVWVVNGTSMINVYTGEAIAKFA